MTGPVKLIRFHLPSGGVIIHGIGCHGGLLTPIPERRVGRRQALAKPAPRGGAGRDEWCEADARESDHRASRGRPTDGEHRAEDERLRQVVGEERRALARGQQCR